MDYLFHEFKEDQTQYFARWYLIALPSGPQREMQTSTSEEKIKFYSSVCTSFTAKGLSYSACFPFADNYFRFLLAALWIYTWALDHHLLPELKYLNLLSSFNSQLTSCLNPFHSQKINILKLVSNKQRCHLRLSCMRALFQAFFYLIYFYM